MMIALEFKANKTPISCGMERGVKEALTTSSVKNNNTIHVTLVKIPATLFGAPLWYFWACVSCQLALPLILHVSPVTLLPACAFYELVMPLFFICLSLTSSSRRLTSLPVPVLTLEHTQWFYSTNAKARISGISSKQGGAIKIRSVKAGELEEGNASLHSLQCCEDITASA